VSHFIYVLNPWILLTPPPCESKKIQKTTVTSIDWLTDNGTVQGNALQSLCIPNSKEFQIRVFSVFSVSLPV